MKKSALLPALGEASATLLAALATLASAWWLDPNAGAAVLAVVMCLSLARSQLDRDLRGRLEAAWAMPLLALLASGVALLLYRMPWVGAITFTIGIAASIWLRRFGPAARRAGSLIAVPLVAILTTPYIPPDPAARVPHLLVPMLIGLLALLWVSAAHALFRALRWLPPPKVDEEQAIQPQRNSTMRPIPSTRMALQMAVALAAAFPPRPPVFRRALAVAGAHRVHRQQRQPRSARCPAQEPAAIAGRTGGNAIGGAGAGSMVRA